MLEDQRLDDMFEAARKEPPHRSLKSVEQFVQSTATSTSTSLIVKWLKQYKMNILISTGGILAAAIFLFPKKGTDEATITQEVSDNSVPELVIVEEQEDDSTEKRATTETQIDKRPEVETEEQITKSESESPSKTSQQVIAKPKQREVQIMRRKVKEQRQPTKKVFKPIDSEKKSKEYSIILESSKGKSSSETFEKYLSENLTQLNHEFSSSASKSNVRKFTLSLDNGIKADFKMKVTGFDTCELFWEVDADGEITTFWYRMDQKETKELDFSKSSRFSIRVEHKHREF